MDYIIVSTSRCKYQAWQLNLLRWSMKKVQQPGKLILLMSKDFLHQSENVVFDFDEEVEVIELPDWAHQWKVSEEDWWGGIPNKYESFNWIAEHYPFKDDDTLLFLDPDMIFTEAVSFRSAENEIIGQQWLNYRPIQNGWDEYKELKTAFMYPFAMRFSTVKKICKDFKEFSISVRKQIKRWESDMWGLDYAAKKNGVEVKLTKNLGRCTTWQSNGNDLRTPIIHYPNIVHTDDKQKLFFKQDYTFTPNQKIAIHQTRNRIDRMLLTNVDQQRTDYLYYLKWDFDDIFKFYTSTKGYLIIQPWPGGFNNIRMSLELGVCLAFLTDRTLVLPPTYKMYLVKEASSFADFFDLTRLGINYMQFEEFCLLKNIPTDESAVKSISKVLNYDAVKNVINFEKIRVPEKFIKQRKELKSEDLFDESENIYLDKNLLGSFEQAIYSSSKVALKKLVSRHVVYRSDLFDLGWEFVNFLGDQTYYAIHIRRNDFQYKQLYISCEKILQHLLDIVPKHSRLYIATDHKKPAFFQPLRENYEVIFYQDVVEQLQPEAFNADWIPIVEQFICTRAKKFVSMRFSTLSSYVFRMRGYMDDIEDKHYYLNGAPFNPTQDCNFTEEKKFISSWVREYKSVWNFKPPTIFVSIASFCDTQIIPTIENLLEEVFDASRMTIGVHMQDTPEQLAKLKARNFPRLKIIFTEHSQSKGAVWARNRIKRELFDGQDYFLQVDSHSRFKRNWDNILVNQYESIEEEKVIISTYPNNFEISDRNKGYLKLTNNSPLIFKDFLTDRKNDNRLKSRNLPPVKDYVVAETKWIAAGFLFAPSVWVQDIVQPDDIRFNGEEDYMTYLSFMKGYNFRCPAEATVWHNYNYKNKETEEVYRTFNFNEICDNAVPIINRLLYGKNYQRSLADLESFLGIQFRRKYNMSLIYVTIASYLDAEIRETILDCIQKAKYPQRLRFGICLQYDYQGPTSQHCIDDLLSQYHIKVDKYHYTKSKGIGWARNKAQQFYENEKYCLQVDAHTRFIQNWDELLVNNFIGLKEQSEKVILSYFPPAYQRDDAVQKDLQFEYKDRLDTINVPKVTVVAEDYILEYQAHNEQSTHYKNLPVPVLDSSFIFTDGRWIKEVQYDPVYYYAEEEVALSLRSYSHGYIFYTPHQIVAWHRKRNELTRKHYNTIGLKIVLNSHQEGLAKLKKLIEGKVVDRYGLGTQHNIKDYIHYSGIDFFNRKVIPVNTTQQEEKPFSMKSVLQQLPSFIPAASLAHEHPELVFQGIEQFPHALHALGNQWTKIPPVISVKEFNQEQVIAAELKELFLIRGSDKSRNHNYHFLYGEIVSQLGRESKVNVLEIGIGSNNPKVVSNMGVTGVPGASLRTFRKILPNSKIYGADIDRGILFSTVRIQTAWVDQMQPDSFQQMNQQFRDPKFDLIIDDGLHSVTANLNTLNFGLQVLKPGGWIVIEDIASKAKMAWHTIYRLLPDKVYKKWMLRCASGCYLFVLQKTA